MLEQNGNFYLFLERAEDILVYSMFTIILCVFFLGIESC